MKNKINLNGGYVGLIILLIAMAIIAFFVFRTDLFSKTKNGQNMIEQGNGYIDQAREAKGLLEKNSQKTMGE